MPFFSQWGDLSVSFIVHVALNSGLGAVDTRCRGNLTCCDAQLNHDVEVGSKHQVSRGKNRSVVGHSRLRGWKFYIPEVPMDSPWYIVDLAIKHPVVPSIQAKLGINPIGRSSNNTSSASPSDRYFQVPCQHTTPSKSRHDLSYYVSVI